MRLENFKYSVVLLALPAMVAVSAAAQMRPINPQTVRDQLNQAPSSSSSVPAARPVASPGPVTPTAKAPNSGRSAVEKPAQKGGGPRRDPFDALLNKNRGGVGGSDNLPPGKAGLVVSTLRLDGIVKGAGGMIVIASNPQQRVYFLREGDKLYDGSVDHITLESVSFHQRGKDAFGKPIERQVTKRLYPSPGEQQ